MQKTDCRTLYDLRLTSGIDFIYGPEGKKAHAEAIKKDTEKSYRLVVNIVGKERQGKTSLRRLLVGEEFNESEQSTVGIDHELVETLGTSPIDGNVWTKVNLEKANIEECNIIVCKHVRQRLKKNEQRKKCSAEIQSFLKAAILSYLMLFSYYMTAESKFSHYPWFSILIIVSFAFSGLVLFDSLRNGFGMATGVLCLVIYSDSLLRWKPFEKFEVTDKQKRNSAFVMVAIIRAFLYYASIHFVIGVSMGLSMAMGLCFVLCLMQPPWNHQGLGHSVFRELHLHIFTIIILIGIWTLRKPKFVAATFVILSIIGFIIPSSYLFTTLSGLGAGYSHVVCIKIGFDVYVKLLNPFLKSIANGRRTRRCICYICGIIPGVFLKTILEWKLSPIWYIHAVFGTMVILLVELCHSCLEGKVEADPKATFRDASKVLDAKSEACLKLVIRDFAGHPLYHSVHHIYMIGHSVYLIVFNMAEAKNNFINSFADILYWLQAIFVHDRFPSVRAFIIGTHRDDISLTKDDITKISDKIARSLPRQFHNMVVWNKQTDQPIFHVENSVRDIHDIDHANFRNQLLSLAEDSTKLEYPIRYLYFYHVINECRANGQLIETIDTIEKMCAKHQCAVHAAGELEDLLTYFNDCGEIIYNPFDNNQNQLVVLDPKALVDIITRLVQAPPRAQIDTEYMLAWHTVVDLGIATKKLLYHIIRTSSAVSKKVDIHSVITLLEKLDLVCKLRLGQDGKNSTGEKCYLLMPLLKDTLPYPQNYWDDNDSDTVIYVDFGPVIPKFIFTRLMCQCTSESHIDIGMDGSYHLNVSTTKALFTFTLSHSHTQSVKLELLDLDENVSPTQQLLKMVIRGSNQTDCINLARWICQRISKIVERDFQNCRYKVGVKCPYNEPHDYCQSIYHIFSLYENKRTEGNGTACVNLTDKKEFWCRGRSFNFERGLLNKLPTQNQQSKLTRHRSNIWNVNILDLPPRLYSDICDDLNLPNVLGRDWKQLADIMGQSMRQVELLEMKSRDPCDALLHEWAASSSKATVEQLVIMLMQMERLDVVQRLKDYIEMNEWNSFT